MKITGINKVNDVTLKRGVILDSSLANWLKAAKTKHHLVVQQINDAGQPVASWSLTNATVTKYTGPTLSGKGNDIAIEELEIAGSDGAGGAGRICAQDKSGTEQKRDDKGEPN